MVFGSIIAGNILVHLNWQVEAGYAVAILFFLAIVYFLALARRMSFTIRVRVFVFLVYTMALTEMLRQGFSTDVFIYFMVLVVLSHLLLDVRGGFVTLGFAITAMLVFAWAVLSGVFVPLSLAKTNGLVLPVSVAAATSNIVGYLFSALTMMTIINMFIVNLNQAWKKETQRLTWCNRNETCLKTASAGARLTWPKRAIWPFRAATNCANISRRLSKAEIQL